jgi:DNA-binding transcriptional ArsR family regulator
MQTIALIDQLRASREIYEHEAHSLEGMSDVALARVVPMLSDATLDRVLTMLSAATLAHVLPMLSDETLARVLPMLSDATLDRVLPMLSAATLDRVLPMLSDAKLGRLLPWLSDETLAHVLPMLSAATMARVLPMLSDAPMASINIAVPVVEDLDRKVAEAVGEQGEALDMGRWHCGTTHCRAGWAITLAGEAGAALEAKVGSEMAGRLIYEASTGRMAPDFFASNSDALADIRRCAGLCE